MDSRMKSLSEDFALTLTFDFEFVPVAIELYKLITPYLQPVGYRHMWFNRSEIKPVGNNLKRSTMNFTFGFEIWFKVTAQHLPKSANYEKYKPDRAMERVYRI